jgi:hypothetical protein
MNSRGDDIFTILNEETAMLDIAQFTNSPTTGYDPFHALYVGILRANTVLKCIDQMPTNAITDVQRAMIKDEALVLRGYQYFLLVQNFGAVPLRLKISTEDEPNLPVSPAKTIWTQVESDLTTAIQDGNLPVEREAAQKGRIEQGTAIAILAKAYEAQHKYTEAQQLLKGLIDSSYGPGKRYQLMENFVDNFTTTYKNNAESVFELQYGPEGDLSWGNEDDNRMGNSVPQFIGPALSGGWAKLMPSASVVSEFTSETRGTKESGVDSKYDKRIYTSFFFTPSEYGDWVSEKNGWYDGSFYGGLFSMEQLWNGNSAKMAGGAPIYTVSQTSGAQIGKFLLKKYTAFFVKAKNADSMGNKEGKGNNLRIMRFAEVLLMYAEACAKNGETAQANWALNEIRQRAGLPQKNFETSELMTEIEHHCLLEFFGEGHRFDDLKRWYNTAQMKEIFKENDKQGANNFREKHKYYPIPSSELNNNSAMEQNSLWQ